MGARDENRMAQTTSLTAWRTGGGAVLRLSYWNLLLTAWIGRSAWGILAVVVAGILATLNAVAACWFHHGG